MGAIDQLRESVKERIETADPHALHVVDAVLNAEDCYHNVAEYKIPEWQQEDVRRRIAARKADPSLLLSREEAEVAIKAMGR